MTAAPASLPVIFHAAASLPLPFTSKMVREPATSLATTAPCNEATRAVVSPLSPVFVELALTAMLKGRATPSATNGELALPVPPESRVHPLPAVTPAPAE